MGRARTYLSDKPNGMDAPVEIAEGLYAEAYLDTEWLMKVLTVEMLHHARYDFSDISVSVVPRKIHKDGKAQRAAYQRAYYARKKNTKINNTPISKLGNTQ